MPDETAQPIKVGDRVKFRPENGFIGRVTELRGPLGPNGAQVYRVRLRKRPRPEYTEVLADQLEVLPPREPKSA